jgi:hypothetical protein
MLAFVIALPLAGCASTETVKTTPEPVTVTVQSGPTEDQATTEAEDTTTRKPIQGVPASAIRSSSPAPRMVPPWRSRS